MRIEVFLRGWEVPSQNVTMRRHWRLAHKERKTLERWIRSIVGRPVGNPGKRSLHIRSVRRRKITDVANLVGGCKGLVDAVVAAGMLADDKDSMAVITYSQQTLGEAQEQRPVTHITVEDIL